ncbi:MAG TPA: ribonuclease Y [Verrucomicrobiae bacterium]|nr:ribonuclease Y [Verrucomicrobiae bacterium]
MDLLFLEGAGLVFAGAAAGYGIWRWKDRSLRTALALKEEGILENARREAENLTREARLKANEETLKIREDTERKFAERRQILAEAESRLAQREALINAQLASLTEQEKTLRQQHSSLDEYRRRLEREKDELHEMKQETQGLLQRIGRLSESEARAQLIKQIESSAMKDAGELARHILDDAKTRAEEQARRILSLAIQRYAGSHTFETTTATLALTGDDIKGRIIGREGRNIRAFEAATGVTVLIDDTPNAVVLSGFDPVRREIARRAMLRLMEDGRIHPTRIEEVVGEVSREMEENIVEAGEDAILRLGLPPLHPEVVKKLGALKFRYSFSQNILSHSVEVAHLMALMAAEMGLDTVAAKKSGLLHDIGKALDHEIEGSHAIIGADFIKRFGEGEQVVNAVASHHDEVPHTNPLGILVSAADAISASRPGARSETMTIYIKRLESLERIGLSFAGVEKAFAVQAGRELRVFVTPTLVTDEQAFNLARTIVRKIEDELQYPGQIRVTVVRETRCVEYAK